jgi:hypothetical protein
MNPQLSAACKELATAYNHLNWADPKHPEEIDLACAEIEAANRRIALIVMDGKEATPCQP